MRPYIAVLWGICVWAVTGCLELATQNPSNGAGGNAGMGGVGGTGAMMAGGGGNGSGELCGNGTLDPNEQCDDGNTLADDSCSPVCTVEDTSSLFVGSPGVSGSADGIGPNARFSGSTVMTLWGNTLFLGDATTVRMVDIATAQVTTIAGLSGMVGYADGTQGSEARFNGVKGLATDGKTLWISDLYNTVLRAISLTPPYAVTTVAGIYGSAQIIDGPALSAHLDSPRGMLYLNGLVYFVENNAAVLRSFDPTTNTVTTLAGTPYLLSVQDGIGPDARFMDPRSITTDGAGALLYIADSGGHSIRSYDTMTKDVKTVMGSAACGHADGPALMAQSEFPRGISSDGQSIYFLEFRSHTVRQLSLTSGVVSTISGTPAPCAAMCMCAAGTPNGYAEGAGDVAKWSGPYDSVYHKASKSLFVSDAQNFVIRRIQ